MINIDQLMFLIAVGGFLLLVGGCIHFIVQNIRKERMRIDLDRKITLDERRDISMLLEAYFKKKIVVESDEPKVAYINYHIKFNPDGEV